MRIDVEFKADDTTLRGWLYTPNGATGPFPTVVMCHGFAAYKEMDLDDYAAAFAKGGLAVLVYDNRCLGASDGEPRHDIDPVAQMRDYRHAISYVQSLPQINGDRIGIWGTSYSGAHVLAVAAVDRRVKCVVSQVPLISGYRNTLQVLPLQQLPGLRAMLDEDRAARFAGAAPGTLPICSDDPTKPHLFPGLRTYQYYHRYKNQGVKWDNTVTLRSVDWLLEYDVTPFIERISPTPLLMIVSALDVSTPTDEALRAFNMALEPKKLVLLPGDHYTSYIEDFAQTSAAAREWFVEHLARKV